ncbi:putative esterase [Gordonia polyisoprenivorans VH2]|uniref:Putative esterase n=1 Tax=Gordonia polyisoprenivorans (strain DSM 44266 / VH2) TaxID=1112204 RepID=H6MTB7_GORPV|nr:alpha/beta hydrolase family protein [Gordonia polyisoprenivorans]AFA71483.1 putative esterase [Gordonia polyisoprenivorans VH2]
MGVGELKPKASTGLSARLVAIVVAMMTVAGLIGAVVGTGQADARINGTGFRKTLWIDACGMPTNGAFGNKSMAPGKVQVRTWFKPQNKRTVILLDGMRAQYDFSGWEINTNVQELVNRGVNVVEPIGGPASFYTDWNAPSNFNGQQSRYMWECVINNRLPQALRANGFQGKNGKYAIMGVSMGGNAALVLASKRRDLYYAAGSLSGYNFLSAPGMHTMIRLAMLDVAPQPWNVDAMWGPPWDGRWYDNDPSLRINRMQGLKLFVGSGNGLFGKYNALPNVFDDLFKGSTLEFLAFTQAKAFEGLAFINGLPIMSYYANGTHAWGYWQDMVWNAYSRGFFN